MSKVVLTIESRTLADTIGNLASFINLVLATSQGQQPVTEWETSIFNAIDFFLRFSPLAKVER